MGPLRRFTVTNRWDGTAEIALTRADEHPMGFAYGADVDEVEICPLAELPARLAALADEISWTLIA